SCSVSSVSTGSRSLILITGNEAFFFSGRRRHTRSKLDWSSDVCSSDLINKINHVLLIVPNFINAQAVFHIGAGFGAAQLGKGFRSEERRVGKERSTGCV